MSDGSDAAITRLRLGGRFAAVLLEVLRARSRRGPLRPRWGWREEWIAAGMRRHFAEIEGRPWPEQRRSFSLMATPVDAVGVPARRAPLGERPALWFNPPGSAKTKRTILYLHGGAYLFGSPDDYAELVAGIARAARLRAVAPSYRLAPEHPFPAALDDALAAYEALLDRHDVAPRDVVVAGDSAGGGLAVAMMVAARDAGLPLPAGAALIGPWADMTARGGSIDRFEGVDVFTASMITRWAEAVLAGARADDPRASPVFADLSGLPPMLVQAGGAEMLLDQDVRLAERARAHGVDVTLRVWEDCFHDWPVYARVVDDGRRAIDELAAFVAAVGGEPGPVEAALIRLNDSISTSHGDLAAACVGPRPGAWHPGAPARVTEAARRSLGAVPLGAAGETADALVRVVAGMRRDVALPVEAADAAAARAGLRVHLSGTQRGVDLDALDALLATIPGARCFVGSALRRTAVALVGEGAALLLDYDGDGP